MITLNKKSFLQAYLKLMRHPGTPESLGRGVSVGLFVAFFIPFSLQMLIAFPLAILVRGARFPALLFTWVSNPFTIPVLYPLQCFVGSYLIGKPLSYDRARELLSHCMAEPSFSRLLTLGLEVALSFFIGGLIFGTIAALLGYLISTRLLRRYRRNRAGKIKERLSHLHMHHKH